MTAQISWLDFKIAYRMLLKHPGLTVTAGLAIAFAVALAAAAFEFFTDVFYPALPVDEAHTLVEIRNRDLTTIGFEARSLHDFSTWRRELRSVREVGAFETSRRTLWAEHAGSEPVVAASMTADAFQIARVAPFMGRGLVASDEIPGAPRVVVISHRLWTSLLASDRAVVGRTVHLGFEPATVVGVMPEGFLFPRYHDVWEPIRYNTSDFQPREGPSIQVLARLAPGSSIEAAQAELTAVGRRMTAEYPVTHQHLRPEVVPYGRLQLPGPAVATAGIYWGSMLFFALLLLLVYGNVALLLFARTASREEEIVVRSALGATRARVVIQLVTEALVLAGGAAAVGLLAAQFGLELLLAVMRDLVSGGFFGYWVSDQLSPLTAVYTLGVTIPGAVLCGIVPAFKVTGRRHSSSSLQRRGVVGASRDFGRLWTTVITVQVAATVAFVPPLIVMGLETLDIRNTDFGFPAAEYLSVRYGMDRGPVPGLALEQSQAEQRSRYLASVEALEEQLRVDPSVTGVTLSSQIPGAEHVRRRIEIDGTTTPATATSGHQIQSVLVNHDFFDVLRAPMITGRSFTSADLQSSQSVVIVNEDFVEVVMGGRNPVGRSVRYIDVNSPEAASREYDIVGVVKQIAMTVDPGRPHAPGIYHPLARSEVPALRMIIRIGRNPASFAPRLRTLAAGVDPTLQLLDVRPLDEAAWDRDLAHTAMFWSMLVAGGLAVLLATSGIYAIMSFTVSRRTREIGVRVALGAGKLGVMSAVLSRTLRTIGIGVATGGLVSLILMRLMLDGTVYEPTISAVYGGLLSGYLLAMFSVCLLACLVPTTRALRVQPADALRREA